MTTPKVGPKIALLLEPLADDIPWECRVRRALKALLRCYRLKNTLFVTPETLENSPDQWREVSPVNGFDASETEPPF
jgi:hypothetical protein